MAASHGEQLLVNATATGAAFNWPGGRSVFTASCTSWNAVTCKLQKLLGDGTGTNWIDVSTTQTNFSAANGNGVVDLEACQVRASLSGTPSAGVYASLCRVAT